MEESNRSQLYRKRLREKIHYREQLLLNSRIKSQQNSNYINNDSLFFLSNNDENYNKALCDRKRKRYSDEEWDQKEQYFQTVNMLDIEKESIDINLTFNDLMDGMKFLEAGHFDEDIEHCMITWLNTENVMEFYEQLEASKCNPHMEKEIEALQWQALSIILKYSPILKRTSLASCVENHSSKGLSLVECVFKEMGNEVLDLYCLPEIIEETGLYDIVDQYLDGLYLFDEYHSVVDFMCERALDNIDNSRLLYESCTFLCYSWEDRPFPNEFNFESFFQQLENLDDSFDLDSSEVIKRVLIKSLSLYKVPLKKVMKNGLWDVMLKLGFSYRDNIQVLTIIYYRVGFKKLLKVPLFIDSLEYVPEPEDDFEDANFYYHHTPCGDMFVLLREMIEEENLSFLFQKEFFIFIQDYYDDCTNYHPEHNPIHLLKIILSLISEFPDETKEIQKEHAEIIEWMKEKVDPKPIPSQETIETQVHITEKSQDEVTL